MRGRWNCIPANHHRNRRACTSQFLAEEPPWSTLQAQGPEGSVEDIVDWKRSINSIHGDALWEYPAEFVL